MITLRGYQEDSVKSIFEYWDRRKGRNPLIILPTAAGKSVVQADFCQKCFQQYPVVRILCVTHVKELVEQNEKEMLEYWPDAPTGVWSASLRRREKTQILFASIQSIHRRAFEFDPFDIIIIDESHLIPTNQKGTYRKFLKNCSTANPKVKIVGMTATPFRMDGGSLIGGETPIFDGIAHNVPMSKLMDDGYICKLTSREGIEHIESKGMKVQAGDFKASDQVIEFHKNDLTSKAINEMVTLGRDRKGWMVFCSKVEHAEEVTSILNDEHNIPSACIHGGLKSDRDKFINDFKAQKIRCLVSVGVLTTGFNAKHVDLIAMMRSTKSASLWVQIIGRGVRLFPGKTDCLVLDYGENILRHGPVDEIVERQLALGAKKKGAKGQAVMKRCEKCDTMCYASTRQCPECLTYFPINTLPKIQQEASRLAIISSEKIKKTTMMMVDSISYSEHKKPGKPDSVKVTYKLGDLKSVSEWICFNHEGYANEKAYYWWSERVRERGVLDRPRVDEALQIIRAYGIREPVSIGVVQGARHSEILSYQF